MTKRTQTLQNQRKEATKAAKKQSKAKQRDSDIGSTAEMNGSDSELSELSGSASEGSSDTEDGSDDASDGGLDADGDFDMGDASESKHGDSSDSDWEEELSKTKRKVSARRELDEVASIFPPYIHPFDDLSEELILNILIHLEPADIQNFSQTSKQLLSFTRNPTIRAEWLAAKYPRDTLLYHLVRLGNLANCSQTIDKVTARQPISRYFIQCLFQARGKAPSHFLYTWGHALSLSAFANFMSKGAALFGNDLEFHRLKSDADTLASWINSEGLRFKVTRRILLNQAHSAEETKILKKQAFSKVKQLFLEYKFAPFSPNDPVRKILPKGFALHPKFHGLLVKAGFFIDSDLKEGVPNGVLFDARLTGSEKIAKFKLYRDLANFQLTFSEDHLFRLFDGCGRFRRAFIGVDDVCVGEATVEVLRLLEEGGLLDFALAQVVQDVIRTSNWTQRFDRTAHFMLYFDAFPTAIMDKDTQSIFTYCSIALLDSSFRSTLHYCEPGTCRAATSALARESTPATVMALLQKYNIDFGTVKYLRILRTPVLSSVNLLEFAGQFPVDQPNLQRSIFWAALETPGLSSVLREALRIWPVHLPFVKKVVIGRKITRNQPSESTVFALTYGMETVMSEKQLGKFHRRATPADLEELAPYAPKGGHLEVSGAKIVGDDYAMICCKFQDDAEVLTTLLTHAALNSNFPSVTGLLSDGAHVSMELFEILDKANVEPISTLFCAIRRQPFCANLDDCQVSKTHLESIGNYRQSAETVCRPCTNLINIGIFTAPVCPHDHGATGESFKLWVEKLDDLDAKSGEVSNATVKRQRALPRSAWSVAVQAFLKNAKASLARLDSSHSDT